MKVTVYPHSINRGDIRTNPYINDFIHALKQNGVSIANPPHKNPLFSLLPMKTDSDAYIFHWLENVPDYKYGLLQTIAAIWLIARIKLKHKKLVWFLHNKQPHLAKHKYLKNLLIGLLLRKADLIVTHATEGIETVKKLYPAAVSRVIFLHHPTKNRLGDDNLTPVPPETDLLIWGNISRYKGVPEFMRFATEKQLPLQTKIIGKCSSNDLYEELAPYTGKRIVLENRSITFEELKKEIETSRFVLIPYAAESILSSGILMDSLSFGAKVIGPNVGSFRDYAEEKLLKVYTFDTFEDILAIVRNENEAIHIENYRSFLNNHSWEKFMQQFCQSLITNHSSLS